MYKILFFIFLTLFILLYVIMLVKNFIYSNLLYNTVYNDSYKIKSTTINEPTNIDFTKTKSVSLYMIYLIHLVYSDIKPKNIIPLQKIEYDNTLFGYILLDKINNNIYIVFRGTIDINDALYDIKTHQIKYDEYGGKVEKGFFCLYKKIRNQININNEQYNNIIITGHSLGGAIALLCGSELIKRGKKVDIYTYGCPHVFDNIAMQEINKKLQNTGSRIFRIQNSCDIIPNFPLPITISFTRYIYVPIGKLYEFTDNRLSYYNNHSIITYNDNINNIEF